MLAKAFQPTLKSLTARGSGSVVDRREAVLEELASHKTLSAGPEGEEGRGKQPWHDNYSHLQSAPRENLGRTSGEAEGLRNQALKR